MTHSNRTRRRPPNRIAESRRPVLERSKLGVRETQREILCKNKKNPSP